MLMGLLTGAICFLLIYGVNVLNISYDEWLFEGGDLSQHYFGWLYYRETEWQFPVGMISGMIDLDVSVIFMDSIPLFAFIFKLISGVLPSVFQYFGIWGIFSYAMMGGISALLLYRFVDSKVYCWIGSIFFVLSPYVLQRMYTHTSLAGQWIVLLAILVWSYKPNQLKLSSKTLMWTVTVCLAAVIHLYFVPMTIAFCFFDSIRYGIVKKGLAKLQAAILFICPVVAALLELYCMGGFSGSGDYNVWGYGYYSANINTLVNPMGMSSFLPALPSGGGQSEGFGYLGLGIMIIIIFDFACVIMQWTKIKARLKSNKLTVILSCLIAGIFFCLSLSSIVMLGETTILAFNWPSLISKALGIFRASGRFIWVVAYMIFSASIILLYKSNKTKIAMIILLLACCIQTLDLTELMTYKHDMFAEKVDNKDMISVSDWDKVLNGKEKIVFVPYDTVYTNADVTYEIGKYAYKSDILFNSFYVSRPDSQKMAEMTEEYIYLIQEGEASNYAFVFYNEADLLEEQYKLNYYYLDGIYVGVTNEVPELQAFLVN